MKKETGPKQLPAPDDVALAVALLASTPDRVALVRSLLTATGGAALSVDHLATETGLARTTVGAALRTLHGAGLVHRVFSGRKATYWPRRELRTASGAVDRATQAVQEVWR